MSRDRRGFTIVELLVVILIIGILVSIAIPRYSSTRDRALLASVRADVRNAETSEEAYFVDAGHYASLTELQTYTNYNTAHGNSVTVTAAPSGYTVSANNSAISAGITSCEVQVGAGATPAVDSQIICP